MNTHYISSTVSRKLAGLWLVFILFIPVIYIPQLFFPLLFYYFPRVPHLVLSHCEFSFSEFDEVSWATTFSELSPRILIRFRSGLYRFHRNHLLYDTVTFVLSRNLYIPSRFDISFIFVLIYDYRTKKLSYLNQYCFGLNFTPHGYQIYHIDHSDRAGFVLLFLFLTFSSSAIFFSWNPIFNWWFT